MSNRISDKVFNQLESLDDLIDKLSLTPSEREVFKLRFESYKKHLAEEAPMFTIDELLRIDANMSAVKSMYDHHLSNEFLIALEFEQRKNKESK